MRLKYENKIIYEDTNSVELETEQTFLKDNIIVDNNVPNNIVVISYNNNEIGTINYPGIKQIQTKGKWLTSNLAFENINNNVLEYYFIKNKNVTGQPNYTYLGNCNIYLQDGDFIEFKYNGANLPYPTEWDILWIGQPEFKNYYQTIIENKYIARLVQDTRETQDSEKIRIKGFTDLENPSQSDFIESVNIITRQSRIEDRILRITKDGIFYKPNENEDFINFDRAEENIVFPELIRQLNTPNNIMGFGLAKNESLEEFFSIKYLKLVLGNSTKYNHNITYDFSGIQAPSQISVQRGSSYTYNLLSSSNKIMKNKVFMSNFEITDRVISNNQIFIPIVIGNVTILIDALDKENVLRQNYSPNEASWIDNILVDFSAGGYVEAKIDMTNFNVNKGNILSVGRNIDQWTGSNIGTCIHLYFIKSSRTLNIRFRKNNTCATNYQSVVLPEKNDNTYTFRIDKNGVSVDGIYYHSSGDSSLGYQAGEENVLNGLLTLENDRYNSWQVGSAEGSNRSNAFYEYIKIVNIDPEEENNK